MSDHHHNNLLYGRNPVLEALQEGKKMERVYLKDTLTGEYEKEIRKICRERDINLKKVPQIKLDKLVRNKNHQGIVAMGSIIDYVALDMIVPHIFEQGNNPLLILLDNVTDVRNIGGIARSAEVLGAHAIILSGRYAGMINEDSVKTSAGAITRISVCREKNTIDCILALQSLGIIVLGTSLSAKEEAQSIDLKEPICLVLGSEGKGLHHTVESACDGLIRIPQVGITDSLNVSVSAGILIYEAQRQRG